MVLAGDFEDSRERFLKAVYRISNLLCNLRTSNQSVALVKSREAYMLIDQDNANVLSLLCEAVERLLDLRLLRLLIYH